MTRVNTSLPQSNPLFQQEETKGNSDESLQVKPQKKVWGQPTAPVPEPAKPV